MPYRNFRRFAAPYWRKNLWAGLGFAAVATLIALALRLLLGDLLVGVPFLTFFPAIALTAYVCGPRAGIATIALSALVSGYYLAESVNTFTLLGQSGWLAMSFFVLVGAIIVGLTGALQRAVALQETATANLASMNQELDRRVAQRTRDLESANLQLTQEAAIRATAESQVRQMQKMEAVGQLTGGIAHDFNNMLAIIMGSLDLASRALPDRPEKARSYVINAMEGTRRAADLTGRLLAYSRQQPLAPQALEINRLVSDLSEILKRTVGEAIHFETVLAGGVWPMFADATQVESAIVNLCVNSRDAMPEGGRLTLETMNSHLDGAYATAHAEVKPGQYVQIAVTDTGSGMSREIIARAFDPFYTTKPVGKGSGLGLSQVYGFVKQSGGHIKIYSEPGRGTTVRIYLPRYMGSVPDAVALEAANGGLAGHPGETILIVEDDARVRQMMTSGLVELGYAVLAASRPTQALAIAKENENIALLFTDVVMPDMNGRVLAEQIQAFRPDIKVLYTTGYTRNAVIHNGVLDPGIEMLSKPFTLDELAAKVRAVLDS